MRYFSQISSLLNRKFFSRLFQNEKIALKQALKLQRQTINNQNFSTDCTPSYLFILPQLLSDQTQIFEAAVHSLFQIACHEQKYQQDLLQDLKNYTKNHPFSPEKLYFIEKTAGHYNIKIVLNE